MPHELVELRQPYSATFELDDGKRQFVSVLGTRLHNDDGSESNFELRRVNNAQLDGWHVLGNDVHYALGKPADKPTDGWFGYGGRNGEHWLKWRLLRLGYLHWPTRIWQDIGATPTYDRSKLGFETSSVTIGPPGAERTINVLSKATWEDIWSVAGKGIDIRWRMEGRKLKEEIVIPQDAREWIAANRPPTTSVSETWFGFVFRIDPSDIPKWWQAGELLDIDGDNDDDAGAIELRNVANDVLAIMPISQGFSERYVVGLDDGEPIYVQDSIRLRKRIWKDGNNYYLLVGARVDFLNSLHEGDITFDPTYTIEADVGGRDTTLSSSNSDKHYGSEDWIRQESIDTYGMLFFDLSAIPGDATCDSATLALRNDTTSGSSNKVFTLYPILAANDAWPVGASADPGTNYCTHLHHTEDTQEWAGGENGCFVSGTDRSADSLGTVTYLQADPVDTESQGALTAAVVETWFGSPNSNYGIIGDGTDRKPTWRSSNYTTETDYRPKLVVEYTTAGVNVPVLEYHYRHH